MTRERPTASDQQTGSGLSWSMASASHCVVAFRRGNAVHVPRDPWYAQQIRRPGISVQFACRRNTVQLVTPAGAKAAKAVKAKAVDVGTLAVEAVVLVVDAATAVEAGTTALGEIGGDCGLRRIHHKRSTCMM